jgi:hypothetical protein
MKITQEISLDQFESRGDGTQEFIAEIIIAGRQDQFEQWIKDAYPDGINETQLNDILCFDQNEVRVLLSMDRAIYEEKY